MGRKGKIFGFYFVLFFPGEKTGELLCSHAIFLSDCVTSPKSVCEVGYSLYELGVKVSKCGAASVGVTR